MLGQSSLNDVFRFIQFGPPNPSSIQINLKKSQISSTLAAESQVDRTRIANAILGNDSQETVQSIQDLELGRSINSKLKRALQDEAATIATFTDLVGDVRELVEQAEFLQDITRLSDTLLLSAFATENIPSKITEMRRLFVGYAILELVLDNLEIASVPLGSVIDKTILLPLTDTVEPANKKEYHSLIKSVGVADLLVVKQHIKRYEATEIAHVENIMPGETRSREHRHLERLEEILTLETETTLEREQELETTERFELNRETSRTIKEDQKYAFDLNVSAKYGPVVEVNAGFEMEITRSEETKTRSSTTYAKDVVQRSLERIQERVREERIRKIIRETEEQNLHSFVNGTSENVSGIYQFLDKVYEAQVFNYGKRQMFDLMIPEPASYLWHLESHPNSTSPSLPLAPDPFTIGPFEILFEDRVRTRDNHYAKLGAKYGATGLEVPPARYRRSTLKHQHPEGMEGPGGPSESGEVLAPSIVVEINIPDGYKPISANLYGLGLTDNVNHFYIALAFATTSKTLDNDNQLNVAGDLYIVRGLESFGFVSGESMESYITGDKLYLSILPYETGNFTINGEVRFERSMELVRSWQLETYDKIRAAYQDRLLEHQDDVARINAEMRVEKDEQERAFGAPPSQRRQTILAELKKHCISILTKQWYDDFSAIEYTSDSPPKFASQPPQFNFEMAVRQGSLIRFFEHAFEWDQLQYALYPYFWADKDTWDDRFQRNDPDYDFQQFLQAGAARVVLAVRSGFEGAVNYYLENGEPWEGRGEPTLTDPLYISIVDEIRERAGILDDAIQQGEPWEVRLPTRLVILRRTDADPQLPGWVRAEDGSWEWTAA